MKKENIGEERLIPRERWVTQEELQKTEEMVLRHPIMEEAFQRVLELHKPKHKTALVSLCTSTRPYHKSRKWKEFAKQFGDDVDLIINSSGGVIPMEFDGCYPYLTYDVHRQKEVDNLYCQVAYRRLMTFFSVHKYDRIIFNFRPGLRNRACALKFKQTYTGGAEVFILPTQAGYKAAQRGGFPKGKMYPDIDDIVLNEIAEAVHK